MCFVDLDNIDTNKLEKGYFNGSLSISPSKGFIDMITEDSAGSGLPIADLGIASISLKFDFVQDSDDAAKLTMSIMNSGMPYASVIVDVCVSDGKEVSVPDTANTESDPEVWVEGVSFDGLLKNVSESGLPEYVVELVEYYLSALQ